MKGFCFILTSIISLFTCAQKAAVSLSADAKTAQAGDLITFSVTSNVEGNVEIKFPAEFIAGYGTTNGMNQVMDYNTGKITTVYYFSQNGAFKEDGTYTIQAFVKNKKAVYKSNKITVKIEKEHASGNDEISKKAFKQPVFGIIKKSKNQIYEGESVVLEAKVYSRLNINMLESYNGFELENSPEAIELDKSQRLLLNKENYKGSTFLTFTYGKTLVFPNATGKVKIKPFEMSLQYDDGGIFSERIAFTSSGSMLEVLPLPGNAPHDFIGAVGKFDFDYSLDKKNIKQGDVAILTLVVSGVGNLQNINKPNINLPKGVIIYGDPDVKEDITYGLMGAEGKVTFTYHLQFNTADVTELAPLSIAYFDPNQKKYIQIKGSELALNISKDPNFQASIDDIKPTEEKVVDENIPVINSSSADENGFYSSAWFWPTVLSPLFLGFLAGIFIVKKKESNNTVNDKKSIQKGYQNLLSKIEAIPLNSAAFQNLESALKSIPEIYKTNSECAFTKADLLTVLAEKGIDEKHIAALNNILIRCEEARFSFQVDENHMSDLIQESKSVIAALHG